MGYWPSLFGHDIKFFFITCIFMNRDRVEVHKHPKKRTNISHLDRTSMVTRRAMISKKNPILLRDTVANCERARMGHVARSGSQSKRWIQFIFLAHWASHWITPVIFFSARERAEFSMQSDWFLKRAEFSHPDRHSGRNPSSWSIFVNEFAEIVHLSPFLLFHRRLSTKVYLSSPLNGKEGHCE